MKTPHMEIRTERPPIYERAKQHFDIDDDLTIYTWGNIIYNPAECLITEELLDHEGTHAMQQKHHPGGVQGWWEQYFGDVPFRMEQEIEAYGRQYRSFCKRCKDRNRCFAYLNTLATYLSSPMYQGNMSKGECLNRIKHSPEPYVTD